MMTMDGFLKFCPSFVPVTNRKAPEMISEAFRAVWTGLTTPLHFQIFSKNNSFKFNCERFNTFIDLELKELKRIFCPRFVPSMKISFYKRDSGSIRCYISIKGFKRFRKKVNDQFALSSSHRWIDQRASGKNSVLINQELDRIEAEISSFVLNSELKGLSAEKLEREIDRIISGPAKTETKSVKTVRQYFDEFMIEKKTEVNPRTKKMLSYATIRDYNTAIDKFKGYDLEDVTKGNYHKFTANLLVDHSPNYVGKIIRKLRTFFAWCDDKDLNINKEWKAWKPLNEETEEEERALNSEQLDRIYNLEVDPIDVYKLAKELHNKKLDGAQVQELTISIKAAANQAVAMASIGAHKEDFWSLSKKNIKGNVIVYKRGKNDIKCIAPFLDNSIFHAREFANMDGGKLFPRMTKINYYLTYVKELAEIPFHITAKSFRKTFASIIYYETDHPNRMQIAMKALGHVKESTFRDYLGIQMTDLEKDHEELFKGY